MGASGCESWGLRRLLLVANACPELPGVDVLRFEMLRVGRRHCVANMDYMESTKCDVERGMLPWNAKVTKLFIHAI